MFPSLPTSARKSPPVPRFAPDAQRVALAVRAVAELFEVSQALGQRLRDNEDLDLLAEALINRVGTLAATTLSALDDAMEDVSRLWRQAYPAEPVKPSWFPPGNGEAGAPGVEGVRHD